jgi:hypothetical protein
MIMHEEARRVSPQPRPLQLAVAVAAARRVSARTYTAARRPNGLGTVTEGGWDLNPVRTQAAGDFPQWQFDWGSGSTPVGRDWLAWALHERLGYNRANLKHAAAFRRLVGYLGDLPDAGWTRTLTEFRAVARRPTASNLHDVTRGPLAAAAS